MSDKSKEEQQTTAKGLEIPVPKREAFANALKKIAGPPKPQKPKRD